MESLEIKPIRGDVDAEVELPGSKSITNRALLIAALSDGRSTLEQALYSDDTRHMAEGLRRLGIEVEEDEAAARFEVSGAGGRIPAAEAELFAGNSGTTVVWSYRFASFIMPRRTSSVFRIVRGARPFSRIALTSRSIRRAGTWSTRSRPRWGPTQVRYADR